MLDIAYTACPHKILKRDPRSDASIEALLEVVASMNIRSDIPTPIIDEFQRAKDLIIFSFFKYEFLTLAARSALFAYEAALKSRYVQALDKPVVLECDSKIIREFVNASHQDIREHIQEMRKRPMYKHKTMTINGKRFPITMNEIKDWLISDGMPESWLSRYEAAINFRNSMAHTEKTLVLPLSSAIGITCGVMNDINKLFDHYPPNPT